MEGDAKSIDPLPKNLMIRTFFIAPNGGGISTRWRPKTNLMTNNTRTMIELNILSTHRIKFKFTDLRNPMQRLDILEGIRKNP